MSYLSPAEEMFKALPAEDLQQTLCHILNEDYYADEFTYSKTLNVFLYMLEVYGLVFVSSDEERLMLTPLGEKTLYKLNSMLY